MADEYQSHRNFIPEVLEKLSKLYLRMNKMDLAYKYLEQSKILSDSLFGARSTNNRGMLEIKDEFRLEQERQRKQLEQNRLLEMEQKQHILFLRNIILLGSLFILVLFSAFVFWFLKAEHRAERLLTKCGFW